MKQNIESINIINEIYNQIQNHLNQNNNSNFDEIVNLINENCGNYVNTLNSERIETLNDIVQYFKDYKLKEEQNFTQNSTHQNAQITFACVQNSRRSHFAEIWFYISLIKNGINWIDSYSGGTEATFCNSRVIDSLKRFGVNLNEINDNHNYETLKIESKSNQLYNLHYNFNYEPQTHNSNHISKNEHLIFSKVYNDNYNPQKDFCAVLVCADDDTNCPAIFGSNGIFHLAYIDPKLADDSPLEQETYDKKSIEIGLEMIYIANHINI